MRSIVIALLIAVACAPGGVAETPRPTTPSERTPSTSASNPTASPASVSTFAVPAGMRPHDVAPARDGGVWFTAQGSGELGWLDPATGTVRRIALGEGSAP